MFQHDKAFTCALFHLKRTELAVWGEGEFEGKVDLVSECDEQVNAVAGAAVKVCAFGGRVEPRTQHSSTSQALCLALNLLCGDEGLLLDGEHLQQGHKVTIFLSSSQ